MAYRIEIRKSAREEIEFLPKRDQRRIVATIESLAEKPRPPGAERPTDADEYYRVCVGDYRIIYEIADRRLVVLVIKVGRREDVYRRL